MKAPSIESRSLKTPSFDPRTLHRSWWTTPLFITACTFGIPFVALSTIVTLDPNGTEDVRVIFLITLGIALLLGVSGLVRAKSFASSVQTILKSGLGVSDLPIDHPLTIRVHRLSRQLGLPNPKVAMMRTANAYAIGGSPEDAAVVIGLPFIERLTPEELDAVIAHELGHIVSGDMRRMQFAEAFQIAMADIFSSFVNILVSRVAKTRQAAELGYSAGLLGRATLLSGTELIVKRTSRSREYTADAVGALMTSKDIMASALRKIHAAPATSSPLESQYASLMFYSSSGRLFSTHPSLDQRLAALEEGTHQRELLTKSVGAATPATPATTRVIEPPRIVRRRRSIAARVISEACDFAEDHALALFVILAAVSYFGGKMIF